MPQKILLLMNWEVTKVTLLPQLPDKIPKISDWGKSCASIWSKPWKKTSFSMNPLPWVFWRKMMYQLCQPLWTHLIFGSVTIPDFGTIWSKEQKCSMLELYSSLTQVWKSSSMTLISFLSLESVLVLYSSILERSYGEMLPQTVWWLWKHPGASK